MLSDQTLKECRMRLWATCFTIPPQSPHIQAWPNHMKGGEGKISSLGNSYDKWRRQSASSKLTIAGKGERERRSAPQFWWGIKKWALEKVGNLWTARKKGGETLIRLRAFGRSHPCVAKKMTLESLEREGERMVKKPFITSMCSGPACHRMIRFSATSQTIFAT